MIKTRLAVRDWGERSRGQWAVWLLFVLTVLLGWPAVTSGQMLINVDFGVGRYSGKSGFAATGQSTNDFWNLYSHYDPKYAAGMPLVTNGVMHSLKYADGQPSRVSLAVTNAPGVWGSTVKDPMYGSYLFAHNRSNIEMVLTGLPSGRYHFFLYGYAEKDVVDEQLARFRLSNGKETLGPITAERHNDRLAGEARTPYAYALFRDVEVVRREPVTIEVLAGADRVSVINGMQIISRGTHPPRLVSVDKPKPTPVSTNLFIRQAAYQGQVDQREARFDVQLNVESMTTNRIRAPLFKGNVAVLGERLPGPLWLERLDDQYFLFCRSPGQYDLSLNLFAEVQQSNSWRRASFIGPAVPKASIDIETSLPNGRVDLLSGVVETRAGGGQGPASGAGLRGHLLGGTNVALRWQAERAEVARKTFIAVRTEATATVRPSVIAYQTDFAYNVLQAGVERLALAVPKSQTVTRVEGAGIRDWSIESGGEHARLTVPLGELRKGRFHLRVLTEQDRTSGTNRVTMTPPAPLEVDRETGRFQVKRDRMGIQVRTIEGGKRVDGDRGASVAYRFYGRPLAVNAIVTKEKPRLSAKSRADVRVGSDRLEVTHSVELNVEAVAIYELQVAIPAGVSVLEVNGDGIERWDTSGGQLRIELAEPVIGQKRLSVRTEQAVSTLPAEMGVVPLEFDGAEMRRGEVTVTPLRGVRARTVEATNLRKIPVSAVEGASAARLAFVAATGDWRLTFSVEERLPRVMAETFDLLTVADGMVGGSSVIRYAIENRGVKSFRLKLPSHWEHVELTGQGIRRREQAGDTWTIHLQETAWEGYTLVITYEVPFDSKAEALSVASPTLLGVERQTGTKAVTGADGVEVEPEAVAGPLRRIDPSELAASDRALTDRNVRLAYRYTSPDHKLTVRAQGHDPVGLLGRVAEHIGLTTVLTDSGQAVTEASLLLRTRDSGSHRFQLPAKATLWGCYVDGEPVTVDREEDWLIVSLPKRAVGRRPVRVDIKYAEPVELPNQKRPTKLDLTAPVMETPRSYAEWDLFVPQGKRAIGFRGDMTAESDVGYDLGTAWFHGTALIEGFVIDVLLKKLGPAKTALVVGGMILIVFGIAGGFRFLRSQNNATIILVIFGFLVLFFIFGSMMLPSLSKAKARAERIKAVNNLKQIGLGSQLFAEDHGRYPRSPSEMMNELGNTDKVLIDPETGRRVVYLGSEKYPPDPDDVIAYFRQDKGDRVPVLFGDGRVSQLGWQRFAQALGSTRGGGRGALAEGMAGSAAMDEPTARAQAEKEGPSAAERSDDGAAAVAGIRSISIDIPKSGHRYSFHKLLPLDPKPLSLGITVMDTTLFELVRGGAEALVALSGIIVLVLQCRKGRRSSFWLAVGTALVVLALGSVLMSLRLLHWGVASSGIVIALLLIVAGAWRLGRMAGDRFGPPDTAGGNPGDSGFGGGQTTGFFLAFLVAVGLWSSSGTAYSESAKQESTVGKSPLGGVVLMDARYQGQVKGDVGVLDVTFTVEAIKAAQTVPLAGADVAVQSVSSDVEGVAFLREGGQLKATLKEPGRAQVEIRFLVKVEAKGSSRRLGFRLPDALTSHFDMTIPKPNLEVRAPKAVSLSTQRSDDETRIEAVLGAADRFELIWSETRKEAEAGKSIVSAQRRTLVTAKGSLLSIGSRFLFKVSQGQADRFRVTIPTDQKLARVEGSRIDSWRIVEPGDAEEGASPAINQGGRKLEVALTSAVTNRYQLTIETERAVSDLPVEIALEAPRALNVRRETGVVGIRSDEASEITVERMEGLERAEPATLGAADWIRSARNPRAYRFSSPDYTLNIGVTEVTPWIDATVENHVVIGRDQVRLESAIDYTIERTGVFGLRVGLPAGFQIMKVGGEGVKAWREDETEDGRVVAIELNEGLKGQYSLRLSLADFSSPLDEIISIPGVHPVGADSLEGFVTVGGRVGVDMETVKQDGLVEVPASRIGGRRSNVFEPSAEEEGTDGLLAFRRSVPKEETDRRWALTVKVAEVPPWIRSDVVQFVRLSSELLQGSAAMRYDIQGSPVSTIRLRVPEGAENVVTTGLEVRERKLDGNLLTAELQNPIFGTTDFKVEWEASIDSSTDKVTVTGIRSDGVDEESGYLGIGATAHLQVSELNRSEAVGAVAPGSLPQWAHTGRTSDWSPADLALAYRYPTPEFRVGVEVQRLEEAAVLQAIIDQLSMTTVMAASGKTVTRMRMRVQNNGKQYLEIDPAREMQLWSAFVNDRPVRPSRESDRLLLPLMGASEDEGSEVTVETVFADTNSFPQGGGKMRLSSPELDVPLKEANWTVYLPTGHAYRRFRGTMTHEGGGEMHTLSRSYADYNLQASRERKYRESVADHAAKEARLYMSQGKLQEAGKALSKVKGMRQDNGVSEELSSLEERFEALQTSNLIRSQKAFSGATPDREGQERASKQAPQRLEYAADVAKRQWRELQRAQSLGEIGVTALRAQLPEEGIRHHFSQALQTETSKPLTIEFSVTTPPALGWLTPTLAGIGCFLILWGGFAWLGPRSGPSQEAAKGEL